MMPEIRSELRSRALRGLPTLLAAMALAFLVLQALAYAGAP